MTDKAITREEAADLGKTLNGLFPHLSEEFLEEAAIGSIGNTITREGFEGFMLAQAPYLRDGDQYALGVAIMAYTHEWLGDESLLPENWGREPIQ